MIDASVREILNENVNASMIRATVSGPRKSGLSKKWVFRPFLERGRLMFQQEEYRNNQVFHTNMDQGEAVRRICSLL